MVGGLFNKTSISQDINVNTKKITEMLGVLSNTFIVYVVKPYLSNKLKEQIKSPKVYFQDLGFKNSLMNNFSDLSLRQDKGNILENFVLNLLIRKGYEVNFWNYKNRWEIDFVIEKNGKVIGIECKSNLKNNKITNSTREFIKREKVDKVYVVNQNIESEIEYEGVAVEFISYLNLVGELDRI